MGRLVGAVLLLGAAGVTACSGGDTGKGRSESGSSAELARSPERSPPPLRTNAVAKSLSPGLLRFEDLPAGWRPSQESAGSPEDTTICGAALADLEQQREKLGEAGVTFERSPSGPYLIETIAAYPPGGAEQAMADLTAAVQTCREVIIRDEEGSLSTWQLTPVPFPQFGDQTLAFREYWPANNVEAVIVYIRRGDHVLTLLHIAINSRVERLETEAFVSRAYERFLRLDGVR